MKVRINHLNIRIKKFLNNSSLQFPGLNGGYWGAVGVRGAVREKIKKQESLEKEDTKIKKKIKRENSAVIRSPSITVENILTKFSMKSTNDNENSMAVIESILDDILLMIPEDENIETQLTTSLSDTKKQHTPTPRSPQKITERKVKDKLESTKFKLEVAEVTASLRSPKTANVDKMPKQDPLPSDPNYAFTEAVPSPEEDANIYDFVQEDFFDSFRESNSSDAGNQNILEGKMEANPIDEDLYSDNGDLSKDDIWSSFNNIKDDIWSSVNDIKRQQRESKTEKLLKNKRKNEQEIKTKENTKLKEDLFNTSFGSDFEGWPPCLDVKDEITGDDDVWASTNEILRGIEISMSDMKASKANTEKGNKEKSKDESRKSRQTKKRAEEIIGNPDSGKENADVDNVELKKSDKTHSPVSKRKKISNRKYFNEDFDDSVSPYRSSKRSSIDSIKSDTNSNSSRGRTTSTSTDEGSECETKKNAKEKDRKFVRNSHFKQSSKSIVLIDPSPNNPEYVEEKKIHKSKMEASLNHKKKITVTDSSVKKSNKPSTILINIFDEKYEKPRKDSTTRNLTKKK